MKSFLQAWNRHRSSKWNQFRSSCQASGLFWRFASNLWRSYENEKSRSFDFKGNFRVIMPSLSQKSIVVLGPYRKIPNCCRSIGWTCDQHCSLWRKSNFIDSIRMVLQRRFGIFDKLFSFAFPIPQTNIMITIKMKIIFKKWKINSKGNWPWCCG